MPNEITAQRAKEYKLEPQGEKETDRAFRERIADALRAQGLIIEAHEARSNRLYNDPGATLLDSPIVGITGAMAQALHQTHYPGNQVDNDCMVGACVKLKKEVSAEQEMATLMLAMMMHELH